ncbi:MAG: hypothetical protein ACFFCW_27390 [Candidatus Hodarchaeota archaeon]
MKKLIQYIISSTTPKRSFRTCCAIYVRLAGYLMLTFATISFVGCSSYVTPGGGADLASLNEESLTDTDIQKILERKPASSFPAHLAVVRIQAPGYRCYRHESYGSGRYSVITTKDIETDEHFEKLRRLPMISAVAPLNQILLPTNLKSYKELRMAAAHLHADLLFVYTLNTIFRLKDHDIGPMGIITLGFLPNQEAQVTTTASAVLFDVRTGFTYGLAEATDREKQFTSAWTSSDTIDDSRRKAETKAFGKLLDNFAVTWKGIVEQYATH